MSSEQEEEESEQCPRRSLAMISMMRAGKAEPFRTVLRQSRMFSDRVRCHAAHCTLVRLCCLLLFSESTRGEQTRKAQHLCEAHDRL